MEKEIKFNKKTYLYSLSFSLEELSYNAISIDEFDFSIALFVFVKERWREFHIKNPYFSEELKSKIENSEHIINEYGDFFRDVEGAILKHFKTQEAFKDCKTIDALLQAMLSSILQANKWRSLEEYLKTKVFPIIAIIEKYKEIKGNYYYELSDTYTVGTSHSVTLKSLYNKLESSRKSSNEISLTCSEQRALIELFKGLTGDNDFLREIKKEWGGSTFVYKDIKNYITIYYIVAFRNKDFKQLKGLYKEIENLNLTKDAKMGIYDKFISELSLNLNFEKVGLNIRSTDIQRVLLNAYGIDLAIDTIRKIAKEISLKLSSRKNLSDNNKIYNELMEEATSCKTSLFNITSYIETT